MILTCPSCSTRYFADDASIGTQGRSVRCASCAHTWFVEPQLLLNSHTTSADPEPALTREQVERLRRAAQTQRSTTASPAAQYRARQSQKVKAERVRAAALAWTATGVALAATTTSAVAFREDVTRAFPKAASAYAAIGLDVNMFGLEFEGLQVSHAYDGPNPILVIRGEIKNLGRDDKPAPVLRFGLRNGESEEIQHVLAQMIHSVIPAGGAEPFEVRIEDASPDAVDLEATFSPADSAGTSLVAGGHDPLRSSGMSPVEGLLRLETVAPNGDTEMQASGDGLASRLEG